MKTFADVLAAYLKVVMPRQPFYVSATREGALIWPDVEREDGLAPSDMAFHVRRGTDPGRLSDMARLAASVAARPRPYRHGVFGCCALAVWVENEGWICPLHRITPAKERV